LKNKVVIITGASSGIGKACAKKFAANNFSVVMAARSAGKLALAADELKLDESNSLHVPTDVGDESQCSELIDKTIEKFGRIDVLINNAGVSMRALFEEVDLTVIRKLMDTNFWGTVYCTKYALPHLLKADGSLIGISSIAGKKGLPGRTGYSASKFAMEGFLETLRIENLKSGLHVLIACPGFTNTAIRQTAYTKDGNQQGESPRDEESMMSPDEVAEKIYDAFTKKKRDLILTSQGKWMIWLNKFFPSVMDRSVYNHMAKEPGSPIRK
jgi:short-subunit dehydrogenase